MSYTSKQVIQVLDSEGNVVNIDKKLQQIKDIDSQINSLNNSRAIIESELDAIKIAVPGAVEALADEAIEK